MLHLRTRFGKNEVLQYILIYLIFISSRACLYASNRDFCIYLMLAISGLLAIFVRRVRNTKLYFVLCLLAASFMLTRILNSGGLGWYYFSAVLSTILTTYTAYQIDVENFLERYLKVTYFFALVSLIFWALSFISPNLLQTVLKYETDFFGGTRGVLLYSFQYEPWIQGYHRNNGIFTEPGIYQIVLNTAVYVLLFFEEKLDMTQRTKLRYLIVIGITIITTQSTTGYISLLAIVIGYMFTRPDIVKNNAFKMLMVGAVIILINYVVMGEDSIIHKTIVDKMLDTTTGQIDLNVSTGSYRMNQISMCWEIFKKYPLGCGDKIAFLSMDLLKGESTSGGGILYFLALAGILSMLILCYITVWMAWKNIRRWVPFLVYLFMWINTALAQAEVVYGCILFVAFIGVKAKQKEQCLYNQVCSSIEESVGN